MTTSLSNNKGVTLIEMIIAIAISVVLVGLATFTYAMVNNANTFKSASAMKVVIDKAKVQSMGKGNIKGKLYFKQAPEGAEYKIGNGTFEVIARNSISVYTNNGQSGVVESISALTPISSGDMSIEFNTAGMVTNVNDEGVVPGNVVEIAFKVGNRVDAVVLYTATGKTDTIMWYE